MQNNAVLCAGMAGLHNVREGGCVTRESGGGGKRGLQWFVLQEWCTAVACAGWLAGVVKKQQDSICSHASV